MDKTQPTVLEKEEITRRLDKLDGDVKEIAKQFKSIQNSLDAIYQDRDLITDVVNGIDQVRQLVVASDKKNENLTKDVTHTVEKTAEQVKAEVQVSSSEVKNSIVQKVVKGITKSFQEKDKTLAKKPWFKRLLFWSKSPTVKVAV